MGLRIGDLAATSTVTWNDLVEKETDSFGASNRITLKDWRSGVLAGGALFTAGDHLDLGTNPATVGGIRLANNNSVAWRNAANGANHTFVLNASDLFAFSAGVAVTGPATITSASASALAVGRLGATNPVLLINSVAALQADGLSIAGGAAGDGVSLAAISSGSNAPVSFNAKGTGTISIGNSSTGDVFITPNTAFGGTVSVDGALFPNAGIQIPATEFIFFGVGSDTGIVEFSADLLRVFAGGVPVLDFTATSVDIAVDLAVGNVGVTGDVTIASTKFLYLGVGSNTGLWEASVGTVQIVVEGAGILTLTASTAAVAGTLSGTRVVGGTDIASAVAFGVFSDNEYSSATDAAITTALGAVVSYGNAVTSGTAIALKTQLNQTAGSSGTGYGSHTVALTTHSSGTSNALVGHLSAVHASVSGGTITTAVALQAKILATTGATITGAIGLQVQTPSGGGTISAAVGIEIQSQTGVAIRVGTASGALDDTILNFTGSAATTNATRGFLFISACAGTPTGTPDNAGTGRIPMIYDSTNNRIYFNNGGVWRSAVVS